MRDSLRGRAEGGIALMLLWAISLMLGQPLLGQLVPSFSGRTVADLDEYTVLDLQADSSALPSELPSQQGKPLLVLGDRIDLRARGLRAPRVLPRQVVFVARELVVGQGTRISLEGERPVTWPPEAAKTAPPITSPDGGLLILVAEVLRLEAGASEENEFELPEVMTVDLTAGQFSEQVPGSDGRIVVAFHRLELDDPLRQALCRPLLDYLDTLPRNASGAPLTSRMDRLVLARAFDERNPLALELKSAPAGEQALPDLADRVARACSWEVDHAAPRLISRLFKVNGTEREHSLPPPERDAYQSGLRFVITDFSLLQEVLPIRRVMTLWSIKRYEHLANVLEAAAARGDAPSIEASLKSFEESPDSIPDEALIDRWAAARDRLRRALLYYRPARPGARLASRLVPDVVLIEAREVGCGFVIGESNGKAWIVTAAHVVEGTAKTNVTFWSAGLVPRALGQSEASVIQPRAEVDIDLAVLVTTPPPGLEFDPRVEGDSAGLGVGNPVWSMSAAEGTILPALDVGVVRVPAGRGGFIQAEGLESLTGNSGCPMVSDSGIVGLIQKRNETGLITYAIPINAIRELVQESWGIAWGLTSPPKEAAHQ